MYLPTRLRQITASDILQQVHEYIVLACEMVIWGVATANHRLHAPATQFTGTRDQQITRHSCGRPSSIGLRRNPDWHIAVSGRRPAFVTCPFVCLAQLSPCNRSAGHVNRTDLTGHISDDGWVLRSPRFGELESDCDCSSSRAGGSLINL